MIYMLIKVKFYTEIIYVLVNQSKFNNSNENCIWWVVGYLVKND